MNSPVGGSRMPPTTASGAAQASTLRYASKHRSTLSVASHGNEMFCVVVPRWAFCLFWWGIVSFHIAVGTFAYFVTKLHRYLADPLRYNTYISLRIPQSSLRFTGNSFFLVSVLHVFAVGSMVFHSIRARQLTFDSSLPRSSRVASLTPTAPHRRIVSRLMTATWKLQSMWDRAFGPNGPFGLNGKYFEIAFTLREALEIVMQTYQAYHLSASVPRRWINQLAVASIVLNCVGTPLVHAMFRRQQGWRRLLCLVQDAVLDVCSSVVIPLCVIYPYAFKDFDHTLEYFPDALIMDDVWYVDAIAENRQILITSTADFVATVMPQLSILGCLLTVKHVIHSKKPGSIAPTQQQQQQQQQQQGPSPHSITPEMPAEATCRPVQRTSVASYGSIWIRLRSVASTLELPSPQRRAHSRSERLLHGFFLLWAVVIVSLHVVADARAAHGVRGCRSHLQPWFAAKFACSVMQFNCYSRGIQGHAAELDAALSKIEPSVLQILTVTHCSALSLPPVLRAFERVKGIEIFNSSIVSWPRAAAISAASHKNLGYLYLINSTWSHFPDGVFHGELPPTLTHLIIHGGNFTTLPDGLEELWSGRLWVLFAIDATPLRALRPSFCQLSIYQLSLASTGLKELPPHCLRADVVNINLSGNPMRALPIDESTMRDVQTLMMEYSALEELPDWYERWLATGGSDTAGLFGAPVCDALLARDGANKTLWIQQTCGTDTTSWGGTYPWALMLPQRRLDLF